MTVPERVVPGPAASEHMVQFFDSDESRVECVAGFVAEGYRAGEPTIVVLRPVNRAMVFEQLEAQGIPVQRAIDDGMIVVLNAVDTLRQISRNGSPDATAFETVVARPLAALALRGGRVRAYGEMVDLLAQRGELADAIRLEALWNDLGERTPLVLLCGYSAAHFVATATHRALREICAAHSGVRCHAQDPLATWLLNTAHNAPGGAAITH